MIRALFTYPTEVPYEVNLISNFIDDWDYLHLRKPDFSMEELINFIEILPKKVHQKIILHDHYHLVSELGLGGMNINSRNKQQFSVNNKHLTVNGKSPGVMSYSAHKFEEINALDFDPNYVLMSPIFDSISKEGYASGFEHKDRLKTEIKKTPYPIVALGGVDDEKIETVKQLGFAGYAMLGNVWNKHLKSAPWEQ
ncbi:MAG: thiamine phosphate synthase [Crocinitomicaceae bacterium]